MLGGILLGMNQLPRIPSDAHQTITLRYCADQDFGKAFLSVERFLEALAPSSKPRFVLEVGWPDGQPYKRQGGCKAFRIVPGFILVQVFGGEGFACDRIIVTPYMGKDGGDHTRCFGADTATLYGSPPGIPDVEFRSTCTCGNGDSTGCKQECNFRMAVMRID
jgi:hypothetical protein